MTIQAPSTSGIGYWWSVVSGFPSAVGQTAESYYNAATGSHLQNTMGADSFVSANAVINGAGDVPGASLVQSAGDTIAATPKNVATALTFPAFNVMLGIGIAVAAYFYFKAKP